MNQYFQTSALHHPQTYQIASTYSIQWFCQKWSFNTFYEHYVEFKHNVNDIIKSRTPVTSLSDETNFEKTKIKSLEEEIKKLKDENTTLRENILIQLKIIQTLSCNNNRSRANTPIIDKTKQKMTLTQTILICRSLILLKTATKDGEDQWTFSLKPATNSHSW